MSILLKIDIIKHYRKKKKSISGIFSIKRKGFFIDIFYICQVIWTIAKLT